MSLPWRASFDAWCWKQESRVRLSARRSQRRFVDRVLKLSTADGEDYRIEAKGTTHGGGPSNYGHGITD